MNDIPNIDNIKIERTLTYKEAADKISAEYDKCRIYCECGHAVFIPKFLTRKMCTWCGHLVFINEREKFKFRTLESIKRKSWRENEQITKNKRVR